MRSRPYIALVVVLASLLSGCSDIDSLQDDPNRTLTAQPELLLTYLETEAFTRATNETLDGSLANRYLTFVDGASPFQYYTWQRTGFGDYDNIKQADAMADEAARTEQDVYRILSVFFKSYFIIEISQQFGDVPYSEANDLVNGINKPVYDTQESIYLKVLEDLIITSNELAANDEDISGDVVYGGDKLKWRKLINSYYLRVLMNLSLKDGEAGLDLAQLFGEILENPQQYPIFESNDDSGFIDYVDIVGNRYVFNQNNDLQTAYYMEKTFIDRLVAFEDPRLFVMAEPTPNAKAAGLAADDFGAYGGLLGSAPFSELAGPATEGEASQINPRYYLDPTTEPGVLMGYSELQFILAEAVERGYLSGDSNEFYENGIRASMDYYNIEDEAAIEAYLAQENVQLSDSDAIEQILTQKHIALFINTDWQIFYEQRRTGFPEYDTSGGGTGNGGRVPKRFLYPESEANNNNENLEAAIERQFPDGDDINAIMWLID